MSSLSKNAVVCLCSQAYLPYYQILFDSVRKHGHRVKQVLYHVGPVEEPFDEKVDVTAWYDQATYPDAMSKILSLRARIVLDAFSRGYEKVLFVGADVEFLASFEDVFTWLISENAYTTPHITEPLPEDGKFPSNAGVSSTGHLNTDFVAFKNTPDVVSFLRWQDEVMKTKCVDDAQLFLDQSWLNFLPFLVDGVYVDKTLGVNFAYWRLHQGTVVMDGGDYKILNHKTGLIEPLVAFQYSGLPLDNLEKVSTHQNRWTADRALLRLLTEYANKVKRGGRG